jgi:transcriptional regulator with XRE-family HTH domain
MQDTLARKLRVLRAERGLTLREAEQLTGVDKDTLSKIERGLRHPYDVTLSKLARGYEVPVEDLLQEPVPLDEAPREAGQRNREAERHFFLEHVRELEPGQLDRQVAGYDDAYLDVLAEFDQIPPDAPEFAEHAALLEQTATRGLMLRLQQRVLAGETNLIYLLDALVR